MFVLNFSSAANNLAGSLKVHNLDDVAVNSLRKLASGNADGKVRGHPRRTLTGSSVASATVEELIGDPLAGVVPTRR